MLLFQQLSLLPIISGRVVICQLYCTLP